MHEISIQIDGAPQMIRLDFRHNVWHSAREFPEGEFPLVAEVAGKRYELYSDRTFSEEELP